MHRDMARATLEMLYRLEDFGELCLKADETLRRDSEPPESTRGLSRTQMKRIELQNIRGCIAALQNSIRIYRGSGQQVAVKAG